jgi:hypothetical protein
MLVMYGNVMSPQRDYRASEESLALSMEAEFLNEIQTKVLRVSLLAIHSNLYSFALRFIFLLTHATSHSFCKGKGGKPDRKPLPFHMV